MILSRYNSIVTYDDMVAIYNSLSGRIQLIELHEWEKGYATGLEKNEIWAKKLIENRMLIDEQEDEEKIAQLKYMDDINQKVLRLTILPTLACNFRCRYCYENHKNICFSENDINQVTKYIKRHLGEYNALLVDWFGGEPMLEKECIVRLSEKFIDECRKRGKLYFSSMTTNGSLLDVSNFRSMLNSKVTSFHITLDGLKNTHDFTRPFANKNGSFETVMFNLRNIRDNVKGRFNIIIRTNVNADILIDIDRYIAFLNKEFGNDNRFLFYFRPIGDWGGKNVRQLNGSMLNRLDILYEKLLNCNDVLNYEFYINLLNNAVCQAAYRNAYVIVPNAQLLKCTCDLENEYNKIGELKQGELCIDKNKLACWVICDKNKDKRCSDCSQYASCFKNTCPLNRIKGKQYPCGYDNKYIEYILKLMIKKERYAQDGKKE